MPARQIKFTSCLHTIHQCTPSRYVSTRQQKQIQTLRQNLVHEQQYDTNGGIVEGVWIFHRHGDRAPNRCLVSSSYQADEKEYWYTRIPRKEDALVPLSQYFPAEVHKSQNGGAFLDVDREPFGYLTWRGMDQMRTVGRRYAERYEKCGFRRAENVSLGWWNSNSSVSNNGASSSNDPSSTSSSAFNSSQYSFLDHWDVRAYSTNYLRTVMSVQCFLDGLIGKKSTSVLPPISSSGDNGNNSNNRNLINNQIYAGGGLRQYYKDVGKIEQLAHADHSTLTTASDITTPIAVQVRDKSIDTLNTFDRYPQRMNELVRNVIGTERFKALDGMALPLAQKLSHYLPGLIGAPQAFGGTPSGINWIHANDHFVCRRAHSVPLLAFSDHEGREDEVATEETLASMAIPVLSHLAWRFREWYHCPKLLAAVAAPPLREIWNDMVDTADMRSSLDRRPFVVYSCHDVTLLSLLYAIGADFLVMGEDCGGEALSEEEDAHLGVEGGSVSVHERASWRWWPPYSSTIAFELVRLTDSSANMLTNASIGASGDGYVIRVILNGNTVKMVPRLSHDEDLSAARQQFGQMNGKESRMLQISDFGRMLNVLEKSGDMESFEDDVTVADEEERLDIAGWKG